MTPEQSAAHEVQKAAAAMVEKLLQLIINPESTATVDRLGGLWSDVKLAADHLSMVRDAEDDGTLPQKIVVNPVELDVE